MLVPSYPFQENGNGILQHLMHDNSYIDDSDHLSEQQLDTYLKCLDIHDSYPNQGLEHSDK